MSDEPIFIPTCMPWEPCERCASVYNELLTERNETVPRLFSQLSQAISLLRRCAETWNADYHCCRGSFGHSTDCPLQAANEFLRAHPTPGERL